MSFDANIVPEKLKFAARRIRRRNNSFTQAMVLDSIANRLSFNNWSLLHKTIVKSGESYLLDFHDHMYQHSSLLEFLPEQFAHVDRDAATEEMKVWIEQKYTRLVDFAFLDRESENGFAWPSVDLSEELSEEFYRYYPYDLIDEVAVEMEMDGGPWGIEDYGHGDE